MTFWTIAGLMLALVLLILAWSVIRQRGRIVDEVKARNLAVARQKLKELEAELAAGNLDQAAFDQAKEELEQELLEDTAGPGEEVAVSRQGKGFALVVLAVLVPAASLGLYLWLGAPGVATGAISTERPTMAANPHANGKVPTMAEIIEALEKRVKEKPDDAEAWFMLGRVYSSMQQFEKAAADYEKVARLTDRHPQALIAWADALAMTQGGRMTGKPFELVKEALEKDPEDSIALWLAGQGAYQSGDYQNAIYYWRQAEAGLADKPESVMELRQLIAKAHRAAAAAGVEVEDPGSAVDLEKMRRGLTIELALDPKLQGEVKPGEPLFIFAKAPDGPPMPLAAIRMTAGELPTTVQLTDDNLIRGGRLKDHPRLKIGARIARSGQPMAASGDLQSKEVVVSTSRTEPIKLVIDQVVP